MKWLTPVLVVLGLTLASDAAQAQYKNGQFGFEGGYYFVGADSGLDEHSFLLALRGAYKGSDHWWFSARAGLSFRGEQSPLQNNTVVMFHLMPVDARYYFMTDTLRPFVGVGSTFTFLANQSAAIAPVWWGPQGSLGVEIRLRRDLFLGLQADGGWSFIFEGPDAPFVTATAQLLFFL